MMMVFIWCLWTVNYLWVPIRLIVAKVWAVLGSGYAPLWNTFLFCMIVNLLCYYLVWLVCFLDVIDSSTCFNFRALALLLVSSLAWSFFLSLCNPSPSSWHLVSFMQSVITWIRVLLSLYTNLHYNSNVPMETLKLKALWNSNKITLYSYSTSEVKSVVIESFHLVRSINSRNIRQTCKVTMIK